MRSIVVGILAALVISGVELLAQETTTSTTKNSAKGVPAMQEVEAAGTGATEDEAFKQAVVDAVRQVVGTLVSSENVINNDNLIKDEILTLSNGFVEKILKQDKKKLNDGTWQVKLKCLVRKGQLYGKLREANVPTVKFDGASMFADVVSQLDHQKSSIKMIQNAMKKLSTNLVTATMLGGTPKILERNERSTKMEFDWAATVDVDGFFKNCAPALDAAFSGAALAKAQKPTFIAIKESKEFGVAYQILAGSDIIFKNEVNYVSMAAIPVAKQKNKWEVKFYQIDERILNQLPKQAKTMLVVAHFRDTAGTPLLEVILTALQFRYLQGEDYYTEIAQDINFSFMPLIKSDFRSDWRFKKLEVCSNTETLTSSKVNPERSFWDLSLNRRDFVGASILKHRSSVSVPTGILSKIDRVDLSVEW